MECNKEEAVRAKQIAETKMQMGDYIGAQKIAQKAQRLFPDLENISQLLAVCEVHCSAQTKLFGSELDWYAILQIERFADEATIKKQYRKLALSLHPDKNKFAGAESAFKLIGEAHRVLSDQTKRSVFDMKCRATLRAAAPKPPPQQSNRNSIVKKQHGAPNSFPNAPQNNFTNAAHSQSTGSHFNQEAQRSTFWTSCHYCGIRYQYYSNYLNRVLRCQKCQQTFTAYDLGIQSVPPGSPWSQFLNQKEVPNQRPSKVASQSNGGKPTCMSFVGLYPMSKAGSATGVGVGSKPKEKVGEKEGDGVRKPDATNPRKPGTSRNASKKRSRKSVEESSESCKTRSTDDSEETDAVQVNGGDISGGNSGLNGGHQARRSSRRKQHVSYKEDFFDDGLVSPSKRSKGNRPSSATEEELKEAAAVDGGVAKDDNPAGSTADVDTCKKEVKQKASVPLEESLPNKKSRIEECNTKKEEAAMSDHNDKKSKVDDDSNLSSDFALDPNILEYPDPDFNDFEKNKAENCFAVNQVWAIYDPVDGMPRFYARVKRIISPGFKLQITWLEPNPDDQGEKDWCDVELPVACGKYSNGGTEEAEDRLMFSHQMYCIKGGARASYFIYPREGETWALFSNWDIKWSSTPEEHKPPYQYEFVEVLSDFVANAGVKVAYLGKVKGFVSLFQQTERQGIVLPSEMYRFSHRIPSFRMSGKEREGVPVGSFELDPASLPTYLNGLRDPGDVKMENANPDIEANGSGDVKMENASPDIEANGSSVKSSESKLKPIVVGLARISTPKKLERSDPERETSVLGRSLRESDGTHKNQSQVDTSKCMNEVDSSNYISLGNLAQPNGSATKCQADERSNTPKKHEKNDLATESSNATKKHEKNDLATGRSNTPKKHEKNDLATERSNTTKKHEKNDLVTERRNTPKKHEKNDLAMDALKLRRSPRDLNKKNGKVNASQCTTQVETDKHSDADKEENHGSLAQSKGSASTSQSHNNMKSPGASTPKSSGFKTLEAEHYDFKKGKSQEKFQLDQIWALYSDRDGMPKVYAQVKKIESSPDFRLHVAMLKACSQPKGTTQPVCCGVFKVKKSKTKILPLSCFSHQLKAEPVGAHRYEIYPRKGEVWAVYKNWNSDSTCSDVDRSECDIVEVLEDNDQNTEVVVLMHVNGSNSLFNAPRIQRSKTGVMIIPRAELARFSHQIPAFQHMGKKDKCPRGYWELDPLAVPSVIICLD